jgi:hypothetical protein
MIRFRCPACEKELRAADEAAVQIGKCPCGNRIHIPGIALRFSRNSRLISWAGVQSAARFCRGTGVLARRTVGTARWG